MFLRVMGVAILSAAAWLSTAADAATPTEADVPYGDDSRQVLDFYRAESAEPTPLLFFVHGGGWLNGDKRSFNDMSKYLGAGISVVSVEYRFVSQAHAAGVKPPCRWPLHDAARALQFVRSRAKDWNIDKSRIGACGSSAGACTCLWLAFHDDLADPKSADPVARESTRLFCAGVVRAQTTLDPRQMREWIANANYGAHAFGFDGDAKQKLSPFEEFLAARDRIEPWFKEYSPYELATADDPPIGLFYDTPPAMGREQESTAHSANFGVGLAAKLKQVGVEHELVYPVHPEVRHGNVHEYLIEQLKHRAVAP
ncbi:MAG: alpha/beta hydrolase [Pirellulales bacterium]